MTRRKLAVLLAGVLALSAAAATAALAGSANNGNAGFKTSHSSMLTSVMPGVQVAPILTVGDVLPSGFRFEAIPDGIALRTRGQGRVDLFVNHETSRVPFPYNTAAPTAANGENDFDNAQVSRLIVNQQSGGVLNGSFVVPSSAGYQRFCSSYLATEKEGFDREILFTNEEAIDYVLRRQDSWPPAIGDPNEKQVGLVVALDVRSGKHSAIHGMGRHNHENSVAIPGFEDLVVLSGDDTFTSGPLTVPPGGPVTGSSRAAQSQLYSYLAEDTDSLLADEGNCGHSCRTSQLQRLLRLHAGVDGERERPLREGAEEHRDRPRYGRLGAQGRGRRLPAAAERRKLAARQPDDDLRPASTAPSGCSSTGVS